MCFLPLNKNTTKSFPSSWMLDSLVTYFQVTAAVTASLIQMHPDHEMRADNRKQSWICVKSRLSGFSWIPVCASPSPGLCAGNWFIPGGFISRWGALLLHQWQNTSRWRCHFPPDTRRSAAPLKTLPAEQKHSEVDGDDEDDELPSSCLCSRTLSICWRQQATFPLSPAADKSLGSS